MQYKDNQLISAGSFASIPLIALKEKLSIHYYDLWWLISEQADCRDTIHANSGYLAVMRTQETLFYKKAVICA
ncbi:MAG: hypothetical protein K6T85_13150 [Gorillibacterium sp.]|nr:hypothetical protein [Gorillibacterium sp.]